MTRTQHWLMALLLTTTLLSVAIIITLLTRHPNTASQPTATNGVALTTTTALEPATPVNFTMLSEQVVRQKAAAILPAQTIESIKKVNYEGSLAYQIVTTQNELYLNAKTGDVIVMTPRIAQQPKTVQVSYHEQTPAGYAHESDHEGEQEDGEHDDD